ncbi:MAG: DUF2490 domain-containing protein [Bacteroidaceae bacterium]|nr:DUF2490 domain-containing protein [Bacteroidaceae bacterium]
MTLRQSILALLLFALCSLLPVSAQENDEVGLWHEIGVEKAITKNWDVGLDMEYRSQDKARFSAGLGTSYKVCKNLRFGVNYNFLYTYRPDKYKDKNEGEVGSEYWETGYNHTPRHWYPRHRFSAEATGNIKLWNLIKVSLRERYQLTQSRARTVDKFKHRVINEKKYDFDDDWNEISWYEESVTDETEPKYYPAYTDQVLRSRIKIEYDKKRFPFSPFVSAEAHNSVNVGDHMLLQKVRAAIGSTYKFRKRNEVSLSYVITFDIYDIEDNVAVRQHDRKHAICLGYKYSF